MKIRFGNNKQIVFVILALAFTATSCDSARVSKNISTRAPVAVTGKYTIPVDSTIKRLSFSIVFKPGNRDKTFDLMTKTGGQSFYLQPSEISKFVDIEPATRGETLLVASDKLITDSSRNIVITRPSGKTLTPDQDTEITTWSAGEVATIKNPEPGNWRLNITGSGEFSAQVMADSVISLISWNFVKLGGRPAHEGYFPIDKTPAIGAREILQINLSEASNSAQSPTFQIINGSGKVLDSPKFYASSIGGFAEFAGVVKIPTQDFRIMVSGVDSQGKKYQRIYPATIHPEQKAAPLTQTEIDQFIKDSEQSQTMAQQKAECERRTGKQCIFDLCQASTGNTVPKCDPGWKPVY